jgi:hypothetical protein
MNCENIKELLNAYIDDLLSEKERQAVQAHIASCPSCRKELDELAQAVNLVRKLDRIVPPPWFSEQVMMNIRKEEHKKKGVISRLFFPLYIKLPVQALATVVIAVLAFIVYRAATPEMKPLMYAPKPVQETMTVTTQGIQKKSDRESAPEPDKQIQKSGRWPGGLPAGKKDELQQTPNVVNAEPPAAAEVKSRKSAEDVPAAPSVKMKEKNEIQYDKEAPGPEVMGKAQREADGSLGEPVLSEEMKNGSGGLEMQMRASPSPVMIDVSVTVASRDKSIKEITGMLEAMKARVIGKYSTGEDTAILAEARGTDAKKIIDKLRLSGEVSLITKSPAASGEKVTMRIKVISRQPQDKP